MKYVIITIEWCNDRNVVIPEGARTNADETKVILHYEKVSEFIKETDSIKIYEFNSKELSDILSSTEWVKSHTLFINN